MRYNRGLYRIDVIDKMINWATLRIFDAAQILSGMMLFAKWVTSSLGYNYWGQYE